jgi:murein DD-endopeptidase MepM/ murein hydrolase activator NlpD
MNEAERLEEQRKKAVQQAMEQAASAPSLLEAVFGFLKFFFDTFLSGTDAPNEGDDTPDTPAQTARLGKLLIDSRAIPKWQAFQQAHAGEAVNHASPVAGAAQITSNFGHRHAPKAGASTNHKGVDFGARGDDRSPDILASADGIVLFAGRKSGYGNTVIIGHADGSQTLYGHMTGDHMPAMGSEVQQGQVIGEMGSSGNSTATHLHYEQRNGSTARQPKVNGVALAQGMRVEQGRALAAAPETHGQEAPAPSLPPKVKLAAKIAATPAKQPEKAAEPQRFAVANIVDGAVEQTHRVFARASSAIGAMLG